MLNELVLAMSLLAPIQGLASHGVEKCPIEGYRGLTDQGLDVPRNGLKNRALNPFGHQIEDSGITFRYQNCLFVKGPVSTFGGPQDRGIEATEKSAITGEILRQLNDPLSPSAEFILQNRSKYYFAAMRMKNVNRDVEKWKKIRILVLNPKLGRGVILRIIDWGPNPRLNRLIDISPQAMTELGLRTDESVLVSFWDSNAQLGPVTDWAK